MSEPEFLQSAATDLTALQRKQIIDLCMDAFGEDPWSQYAFMQQAVHLLALEGQRIVAHALYTTRQLTLHSKPSFKTAYVEYVTTSQLYRGQGLAAGLLRSLLHQLPAQGYTLAALAAEDSGFYTRLGWQTWPWRLQIRGQAQLLATPHDEIMLYPLNAYCQQQIQQAGASSVMTTDWREGELW